MHSGSPFRLLLETEGFKGENFVEFGAQGSQCSQEHADYVTNKNASIIWLSQMRNNVVNEFKRVLQSLPDKVFVSFDLDAVISSDAPVRLCFCFIK